MIKQDSKIVEGKYQEEFAVGQLCRDCKKGKLIFWGRGSEENATRSQAKEGESFRCEYCGKIFGNHKLSVREKIDISDEVNID